MADVGRLRWVLTADTRGFERGIDRARRGLRGIGRISAGLLGAGTLAGGFQAGLRTADQIAKISRAVGVSTDELQQFRFAIQETGGEAADMDRALERLSRRVGELAMTHRGQLAEFLRRTDTGLFLTLKGAESTTEAFMALSKAMAALPDQRSRQALAAAAFGRAPPGLVNLLAAGPAGVRAGMGRLPSGELLSEKFIRDAEKTQDEMLLLIERAVLKVSEAALAVNSLVQDIRREISRPGNAISEMAGNISDWIGTNMPMTMRIVRSRGLIGRLFD